MRPLRARQEDLDGARWSDGGWRQVHLNALVTKELYAGAPVDSAAPIPPEQRRRPHVERMQEHADLARFGRRATVPLTLLTERTGTATVDARSIHHAQAAIGFSAVLTRSQVLVCRASQRSIGLKRKVRTGEPPRFPGQPTCGGA